MLLTREQILQAPDIQSETVEVPEWGGSVIVHGLTGDGRNKFEESIYAGGKKVVWDNIMARLVSLCAVDGSGKLIFNGDGDVTALGAKSAVALARVYSVAQRLSGLAAENLEAAVKNSGAAPSEGSISD